MSGFTEKSCQNAVKFYEKFVANIVVCKTLEIAETAKVLENSFRLVNISFINELSVFCQKMGIDIVEVIHAAATKPYGYMPFYPSIGVGGHCIPVDPVYLTTRASEVHAPMKLLELAQKVNSDTPVRYINRLEAKVGKIKNKKILIVGIAYKANVADVRESPALKMIEKLRNKGAKVMWHDDLVKTFEDQKSVSINSEFDLAILATVHDYIDISLLGATKILDTTFNS